MNTLIQKRTNRLVLNHLNATKGGSAITLAGLGGAGLRGRVLAQDATPEAPFAAPVDVINYALTLEHIEATFYRLGLEQFAVADFEGLGYQAGVRDRIATIADHEAQHVDALTAVVEQLGGDPAMEAEYDFGYTNLEEFLSTGAVLEGVGVAAYGGAAQYLVGEPELLTAALTIHGNEGRHAAYLAVLTGSSPFPESFEAPLSPDEVLEIATPFFVEM
jgi:hypothetical protein